ncbi:MAG: hypothetical protein ACREVV_03830 [Steroidobacteraceae bacterium]
MNVKGKYSIWTAGALAALLAAATPAFAQSHGGAGHGGGGGGHGGGGGGHGGGGYGGGGHGGGHAGGFGGGHAFMGRGFAGHAGGFHGGGPRYAPAFRGGYVGGGRGAFHGTTVASAAFHGGHVGGFARPGFAGHGSFAHGPGFGRGGFGYHRPFWGGGYWHGGFWPRAYYGWHYPWFLPILPAIYATYWWGGIPYYYADDVYYAWNSGYNGYVVTDPPPAAGDAGDTGDSNTPPADNGSEGAPPNGSNDVYVYPKNGQSEEQQATDKYECHKWAVAQSGFDPTHGAQTSGDPTDYRRAMSACLDGRGYSAK